MRISIYFLLAIFSSADSSLCQGPTGEIKTEPDSDAIMWINVE